MSGPKLGPHDHVLSAWAEPARGPGWANAPVWVAVRNGTDNACRIECLQPSEQTARMRDFYAFSALIQRHMTCEAEKAMAPGRRKNR